MIRIAPQLIQFTYCYKIGHNYFCPSFQILGL